MYNSDCLGCPLLIEKAENAGVMMSSDYNQRQSDTKLADIEKMILEENDVKERNRLQVLQFLTNQTTGIIKGISVLEQSLQKEIQLHAGRVNELQKQLAANAKELLEYHDIVTSSRGSLRVLIWIVGITATFVGGAGAYGYQVVDNLRLTVVGLTATAQAQAALYPELNKSLNAYRNMEAEFSSVRTILDKFEKVQEHQNDDIRDLQYQLDNLKGKRAMRAIK